MLTFVCVAFFFFFCSTELCVPNFKELLRKEKQNEELVSMRFQGMRVMEVS